MIDTRRTVRAGRRGGKTRAPRTVVMWDEVAPGPTLEQRARLAEWAKLRTWDGDGRPVYKPTETLVPPPRSLAVTFSPLALPRRRAS